MLAPTGTITWQDGEVFEGRMLHDRPCEGTLTYADGSSAQVEYSKKCVDLFSRDKPTPKKQTPHKDRCKRQISESPESTGESGSNSKQQRKGTVTLTDITLATGNADIRHAASSSSKESANGSSIAAAIEPARTSSPTRHDPGQGSSWSGAGGAGGVGGPAPSSSDSRPRFTQTPGSIGGVPQADRPKIRWTEPAEGTSESARVCLTETQTRESVL